MYLFGKPLIFGSLIQIIRDMNKVTQIEHLEADKIINCFKCLEEQINSIKKNFQPKEPPQLISRKDAADFFGVTTVTIDDWTKKGILTCYKISNRSYFKRHELESALIQIKASKHG